MGSFSGNVLNRNNASLDYRADEMDFIGAAVLLPFLFHVEQSAESNIAVPGCSVSLEWTLSNTPLNSTTSFKIYNSSRSIIAELVDKECNVVDNSSTYCNVHDRDNALMVSLTIFNVTARQSGSYILQLIDGIKEASNSSLKLLVVGKPQVMELGKPIFGRPFEMTCNSSHDIESATYRWNIHGAQTIDMYNVNTHSIPTLSMTDHLSQVTCQVCLNRTARNFSTEICKIEACSTDSDPYTMQVIYGPENISLSLSKTNFYLKDRAFFTIDCYAGCNPNCAFRWKGQETIESKTLVITSFEPRMAGQYTCHVKNEETNCTLESVPITLHHVKDDFQTSWIGMGLLGGAVLLVIIGCVLLIKWRKHASNKIDSRALTRQEEIRLTPTNGEVSQGISWIQNIPLHVPNTQETKSRRPYRQMCDYNKRKSRSLHNLLDSPQDTFYPLRGDLSLQLLYFPPTIMQRGHRNGTQDHESIKMRRFYNFEENQLENINGFQNGIKLEYMYARVQKDKRIDRDEHNDGAEPDSLSIVQHERFEQESQENLYSTINEDALSVSDGTRSNITSENSNEVNTRHGEPYYESPDLPVF